MTTERETKTQIIQLPGVDTVAQPLTLMYARCRGANLFFLLDPLAYVCVKSLRARDDKKDSVRVSHRLGSCEERLQKLIDTMMVQKMEAKTTNTEKMKV